VKRLGDGTEESAQRMQAAVDKLYPFTGEFFHETPLEKEMKEQGVGCDLSKIKPAFDEQVSQTFAEAKISIPEAKQRMVKGKYGIHSEQLGFILSDFQYMQRAYPNMEW